MKLAIIKVMLLSSSSATSVTSLRHGPKLSFAWYRMILSITILIPGYFAGYDQYQYQADLGNANKNHYHQKPKVI
jgi:heme/copper-type cytochrome/quinol oxidase subunit 3